MPEEEWKGASFKQDEDHSEATYSLLQKINATTIPVLLRSTNKSVDDYVSELLTLEKVARLAGDTLSNKKLAVEALRIYRTLNDPQKMLETLDFLMKKRGQSQKVQSDMIAECAIVLHDGSLSKEKEQEVLERLAHATDSKIHIELEHARFTVELAKLYESQGRKRAACDMLRSLHIETITTMPRMEKLDAINQQIRLCLELEDYEHTPLVSRKVNHRALSRDEAYEAKLTYFRYMRIYYAQRKSYFNVARCWYEIYLTTKKTEEKSEALSNTVGMYLISEHATPGELEDLAECTAFSPATRFPDRAAALLGIHENLQSELLEQPHLNFLLQQFNSIELIREKVMSHIEELCRNNAEFSQFPQRQTLLQDRSSEHDLMVIARFYSRIPLARLSELVGLPPDHTEAFIMTMVSNKTLYAKMDRVDGLVVFEERQNITEVITSWNNAVDRSVSLLDKVSHLIAKERMLYNTPIKPV